MQKIATIGMFDGVHRGHGFLLESLRRYAESRSLAPLVISFCEHPLSITNPAKAPALLTTPAEKEAMFAERFQDCELKIIPFTRELRGKTAVEFLTYLKKTLNVSALLIGFNNHIGSDRLSGPELVESAGSIGIEVISGTEFPDESASSSIIRNALSRGNITEANSILGYDYTISGIVVPGKQLGRKIEFPTANISTPLNKLIPAIGVYACIATVRGKKYRAMVNIGHRPTVDNPESTISIEAHLIDAPQQFDIYGESISLTFIKFLRNECKFNGIEELKKQLAIDKANTISAT